MNFTRVSLFVNTIFVVFVLSLITPFLKKYTPKFTLDNSDIVMIYAMLCVSSAIAGHDMIQRLFPLIGHAFYYATPENGWQELFHACVPVGSLSPRNPCWLGITKTVGAFITILCTFQSIYPLAQIPLEIISNGPHLFKTRLIWTGFAASMALNISNGIHYFFPIVPSLFYGRYMLSQYFTTRPWNYLGWIPVEFLLFAIGLAFFMPLDLSFSCWFFYWFWRIKHVIGVTCFGGSVLAGFPFTWAQSIGACAAILFITLWGLRFNGWRILKSVFSTPHTAEWEKIRQYRWALVGIVVSLSYLIGFCYIAGIPIWSSAMFFLIFFGLSTVVTRIRAEAGYPMHDFAFRPEDIMVTAFGTRPIGPASLTLFSYLHFFTYAHRSNPQPHQLEAFRLADRMNLSINRQLITAILIATVVGSIASCWAYLHTAYHYRGSTWPGYPIFNRLQIGLTTREGPISDC